MSLAVVQTAQHTFGNTVPGSVTLGSTPTLGNLLIAFVHEAASTPVWANGWTLIAEGLGSNSNNNLWVVYRYVQSGDTTALPAIASGGGNWNAVTVYEISGVNGTWANDFDGIAFLATGGTSLKAGYAIPTSGDLVLVSGNNYNASVNITDTSGLLTVDQQGNASSTYGAWIEGHFVPADSVIRTNLTAGTSTATMAVLALNQTGAGKGINPISGASTLYVDSGATGTGDGYSPVNAATDMRSLSVVRGGKVWVRRTSTFTFTNSELFPCNSLGISNNDSDEFKSFVIGWPDVNDPFYNLRPAAGVSAGWDSDAPATAVYSAFGYKWPALYSTNSGNWGIIFNPAAQCTLANFYAVNCGGTGMYPALRCDDNPASPKDYVAAVDNVLFSFCNTAHPSLAVGWVSNRLRLMHAIFPVVSANTPIFPFGLEGDHIEIHSMSQAKWLFAPASIFIKRASIWSSSVTYLFWGNQASDHWPDNINWFPDQIRVVEGVRPISLDISSHDWDSDLPVSIDDYYGEGPRIISDRKRYGWRMATAAEATVNSLRAVKFHTSSAFSASNAWQQPNGVVPMIAKVFSVVSGTPVGIRVPIYVDSTAAFSPAYGSIRATLYAKGCNQKRGSTITGVESWAGSQAAGGTKYTQVFTFTPQETKSALFEFYADKWMQPSSGALVDAYALFGEPY